MPYDPGEVVEVIRAPRDNAAAGTYRAFAATLKGLRMTFGRMQGDSGRKRKSST